MPTVRPLVSGHAPAGRFLTAAQAAAEVHCSITQIEFEVRSGRLLQEPDGRFDAVTVSAWRSEYLARKRGLMSVSTAAKRLHVSGHKVLEAIHRGILTPAEWDGPDPMVLREEVELELDKLRRGR